MAYRHQADGSMYLYDSAVATTIHAVNQYHAIEGLGAGSISHGVTFQASLNGVITDTDDNGGQLQCTDALHGLTTGDYITLNGMGDAAHVGTTQVTVVDANTFDCDDIAWSSDGDTGFWQRGSALIIDTGHGGTFNVSFSISCLSAGNNKNYKFECVLNTTDLDEFAAERKIQVANDLGVISSSGLAEVMAGDVLWFQAQGTTDASNLTVKHANVHIHKV